MYRSLTRNTETTLSSEREFNAGIGNIGNVSQTGDGEPTLILAMAGSNVIPRLSDRFELVLLEPGGQSHSMEK